MTSTTASPAPAPAPVARERAVIGVLLPSPAADGGFVDGAARAVARHPERLGDRGEVVLDLCHDGSAPPDPSWAGVLCHGGEWAAWLREHDVPSAYPVVLTDLVPIDGPGDPLAKATMVDWQWDQAAHLAGALAAHLAGPAAPIGLVAGPAVLTQRRIVSAFTAGARAHRPGREVLVAHVGGFDDLAAGARLGGLLAEAGCGIVSATADGAGEAGCRAAREHGARTIGFLEPLGVHAAVVDSDVAGVVSRLLAGLIAGEELPAVYRAGLVSGHLELVVADPAYDALLAPHRPAALALGDATTGAAR
ncbi:BMP family ABC transporter substrate-binding protein [uncultured Nocardioides sp.]|jgi:hypothetical protein|uniref:BMP family ABC transporter substrate-binding protein n=1 Tax=uncultured Nocardioides sp. TaxID=198441 RepID=UPI00269D2941|nr:BMP family ABC transporter substrate-binding protein [Nocardioides sp.]